MEKNSIKKDCLEVDELMRCIRENVDSDREKAMEAFGMVYDKYKETLWTICVKVCGDNAVADKVYWETWKKIQKHPVYDYRNNKVTFATWMSRIAHNVWIDILKKEVPLVDDTIDNYLELEAREEEEMEPSFNAKLMDEALAELTDKEREILKIYVTYDTDKKLHVPQEVLDELKTRYQTSSANLRQIKSRALEKVRNYISRHQ